MGKSQVIIAIQGSRILVPSLKLQDLVTVLADQKVLPIFIGIPDRVAIVLADARFEIGLNTYSHLDVDIGNVVASKRPGSLLDLKAPTAMQSDASHSLVLRSENVTIVHIVHKWNRNAGWQDHRLGQNVIDDSSNQSPNVHDTNTSKLEFHVCKVGESGKIEFDAGWIDKGKLNGVNAWQYIGERLANDLHSSRKSDRLDPKSDSRHSCNLVGRQLDVAIRLPGNIPLKL
mmetsp:Transcript_13011/g.32845  ORF Transcript_13011/g.32845 Transcript_13011/m.32845 type:complete len:230 (+) Transcript_13011:1359-2048(+)